MFGTYDNRGTFEVSVPTLNDKVDEILVSEWFIEVGDKVKIDQMLCALETDEMSMEVRSPRCGQVTNICVSAGQFVKKGDTLMMLHKNASADIEQEEDTVESVQDIDRQQRVNGLTGVYADGIEYDLHSGMYDTPEEAEMLSDVDAESKVIDGSNVENNSHIDLDSNLQEVKMEKTNTRYASNVNQDIPVRNSRNRGIAIPHLKQEIGQQLKITQNNAITLTTYNEINMSELMGILDKYGNFFRSEHGVELGYITFFVRAIAMALHIYPALNATLEGSDILYNNKINIGFVQDTETAHVAPVIKDVAALGLVDIEKRIVGLRDRADKNRLLEEEMKDNTFSIVDGGEYGAMMFAPALQPLQSGALGISVIQDRVIVIKGDIIIRPMMYISLSYDNRIIDSRTAVGFLRSIKLSIEDPIRTLLSG